jgi:hypothetical protein
VWCCKGLDTCATDKHLSTSCTMRRARTALCLVRLPNRTRRKHRVSSKLAIHGWNCSQQHVWNLVTGSVSLPQLYQAATYLQNANFTPEVKCNFIYVHWRSVAPQALTFTALATALRPWVVFCMGFQPNRSTNMEITGRNIVTPLCKIRTDFPHNSHLLHRMSP